MVIAGRNLIIMQLLIALTGVLLYSPILSSPFIYDDHRNITQNETIKSVSAAARNISDMRYITSLSFSLNYAFGGLETSGYHLVNIFIHAINAVLLYFLVTLTFRTPYLQDAGFFVHRMALSASLIFMVHPAQIQAVTYIVQRATSMATMFYLVTLVLYAAARLHWTKVGNVGDDAETQRLSAVVLYCFSLFSAVLAMKTKEIAFTLPMMVLLYEFFFFTEYGKTGVKTKNRARLVFLFPMLLTLLIIPLSLLNITGTSAETVVQNIETISKETPTISRMDYLMTQFRVLMTYLRLLIFPVNQNFDYDYPVFHSFFTPPVFISFVSLSMIFAVGVACFLRAGDRSAKHARSLRLISFGIFWFFLTLSIESSIIPIQDVIVEHRLYLPSIGFSLALVTSLDVFLASERAKIVLVGCMVLLLAVATYHRNTLWKEPQFLWEDVIAKAPGNERAFNNLGVIFKKQNNLDKAIAYFDKALSLDPNRPAIYFNVGDVQYRRGDYEKAAVSLQTALKRNPVPLLRLDILNKLGRTYSAMGRTDEAIGVFKETIERFPAAIAPYNNLGVQYMKKGELDLAIETFEAALNIIENPSVRNNLMVAHARKAGKEIQKEKAAE